MLNVRSSVVWVDGPFYIATQFSCSPFFRVYRRIIIFVMVERVRHIRLAAYVWHRWWVKIGKRSTYHTMHALNTLGKGDIAVISLVSHSLFLYRIPVLPERISCFSC